MSYIRNPNYRAELSAWLKQLSDPVTEPLSDYDTGSREDNYILMEFFGDLDPELLSWPDTE